jgi:hypothetical protein
MLSNMEIASVRYNSLSFKETNLKLSKSALGLIESKKIINGSQSKSEFLKSRNKTPVK